MAIDSIHEKMEEIREMGVRLVTVGFGEQAKQSELENIAKENALHFEEFELASTLHEKMEEIREMGVRLVTVGNI